MNTEKLSKLVKNHAYDLGFSYIGISKAEKLIDEEKHLQNWLKQGKHGQMHYMNENFDKRLDPTLLVPGAKSVIVLLYNYFPEITYKQPQASISKYAYGEDYHIVVKDKLFLLKQFIDEQINATSTGRCFVDSAPVLERAWAQKSGAGFIGKNAMLINRKMGSYFFIAEIIIDVVFEYDIAQTSNHCGTCTACIDACPTQAIVNNKVIDANKCISYLTIEIKNEIPQDAPQWQDWMFGCDVCQDVCPWNRFSKPNTEERFVPFSFIKNYSKSDWQEITEIVFKQITKNSPLQRAKWQGIQRTMQYLDKDKM